MPARLHRGMRMRLADGVRILLPMAEYSWPDGGERLAKTVADRWAETVKALPEGSIVTGPVIGRQPFGVFVDINGTPGAIGLAEITSMPRDAILPSVGAIVRGVVIASRPTTIR